MTHARRRQPYEAARPYRDRQQEALTYIRAHITATGRFPTKLGLMRAMGAKSPQSARDMLERLTIAGWLRRKKTTLETADGKRAGFVYELNEGK